MRRLPLLSSVVVGLLLSSCELEEVSLTEPENVLVAEVYLKVGDGSDELTAFLQWTLGGSGASDLTQAVVRLEGPGGLFVPFFATDAGECLAPGLAGQVQGACFQAPPLEEGALRPGERVAVEITTTDGKSLQGGAVLPGDFALARPVAQESCALLPGESLELLWTLSEGAWAYTGEAVISGLRAALAPAGIQLDEDSVTLVGLSISETDTTLVFPREFGIFDRFDLDRELALALQEGLPLGAEALVVVSSLERNYVNWVRGGNFNPSGPVRVPSLRGDGTGVLGGAVRRIIRVVGALPDSGIPSCVPGS